VVVELDDTKPHVKSSTRTFIAVELALLQAMAMLNNVTSDVQT
jgi:hypothetical protein